MPLPEIRYRIERDQHADFSTYSQILSNLSVTQQTLVDQPVLRDRYYRIVRTVDGMDNGISNIYQIPLLDPPVLVATGGVDKTYIKLTWTSNIGDEFNVFKYNKDVGEWVLYATVEGFEFDDYKVVVDVIEYYYVEAVAVDGETTGPSNVASASISRGGIFSMAGTSRSTNYQGIQIGQEITPGLLVPATRRLAGLELLPSPSYPTAGTRYAGYRGHSGIRRSQAHTEGRINGVLDFNTSVYLMHLLGGVTSPVVTDDVAVWTWNLDSFTPFNHPRTVTVEQGSVKGAEKWGYSFLSDFGIRYAKEDLSIEASFFGQKVLRDAVLTPNVRVTLTAPAIAGAASIDVAATSGEITDGTVLVFQDGATAVVSATTAAAAVSLPVEALAGPLDTGDYAYTIPYVKPEHAEPVFVSWHYSLDGVNFTKLLDVIDGSIDFQNFWRPSFHADDATSTFDRIVEVDPMLGLSLTFEEGAEASEQFDNFEAGTLVWIGFKVIGGRINEDPDPAVYHTFRLNMPLFIMAPDPGDKDGVWGNTFRFESGLDMGYGLFNLQITNALTALG